MSSIFQPTSGGLPVGTIVITARKTAPEGWIICDGRAVPPDSPLGIALVEDDWPYGDDKGMPPWPMIPFLRGRMVVGSKDGTYPLGDRGGAAQVTLTTNQMPAHNHGGRTGDDTPDHTHGTGTSQQFATHIPNTKNAALGTQVPTPNGVIVTTGGASTRHGHDIYWQGGSQAHDNMPPYLSLNYIIKADP